MTGTAVGMGVTMQLAMNIRIASEAPRFGSVFSRRGLVPEERSHWFPPRMVGIAWAWSDVTAAGIPSAKGARRRAGQQGGTVRSTVTYGRTVVGDRREERPCSDRPDPADVLAHAGADDPMEGHQIDIRGIYTRGRSVEANEGGRM